MTTRAPRLTSPGSRLASHISRLASIDAFRAITMLLMIFVNDLVLDENVPRWLEHAKEGEDRLGFADTIFPAFLFIVGLSIPLAIRQGESKGMSGRDTLLHILRRSFALLVMGIYAVNYEEYTTGPAILSQFAWLLIATIAFFLTWLTYPAAWSVLKKGVFRGIGILTLAVLAFIYRGGTPEHPAWMKPHWYGILGLIGWCYLICALLYYFIRERLWVLGTIFLVFAGLSVADVTGSIRHVIPDFSGNWINDSGGLPAFTMAGMIAAIIYRQWTERGRAVQSLRCLAIVASILLVAGFFVRPIGGISKLDVSPSWIFICTAISIACFALLAFAVDLRGLQKWYGVIRPAGTGTLACYLLTYIHFSILKLLPESWRLPLVLRSGVTGLLKSMIFAFVIVWITGLLEKRKIRLAI